MLVQRVLTAIPLAAFVVWMIFFQPSPVFFYLVLAIVLISGYEWARLSGVQNIILKCLFAVIIAGVTYTVYHYLPAYVNPLIDVAVIWWFAISYYLKVTTPKAVDTAFSPAKLLQAFIILPAAALAMQHIHTLEQGATWLFYALSLVWVADIGAYFSGKRFGKNKLAPAISPGKTMEGVLGALLATSLYTFIISRYFELDLVTSLLLLALSVLLTLISISGDLFLSFLKREAGLKDSGSILPGHGGILDRIDSVLAALPVFVVGYTLIMAV